MNKWMKIAYNEAVKSLSNMDGGPFGAVIVRNEKIIATGRNEVLLNNDPTAHAEVNAIRKASKILKRFDLKDCTLYTTCFPCPMCIGAIFWARIPIVYYGATEDDASHGGFDDKIFYKMIKKKNRYAILHQIDHKKNAKLFDKWNNLKNKKIY